MILYEVTLQAEPAVAPALEEYMIQSHIPDIFTTGCFRRIRFSGASSVRFRTSYQADTPAELDRYLHDHAPRLRAEFLEKFPAGVTITRETWIQREVWG